jgi:hypothetical protein
MFKAVGLPGRTRAYDLAKSGALRLVKDAAGRVGVAAEEARRYVGSARPIGECKRDMAANRAPRGRRTGQ